MASRRTVSCSVLLLLQVVLYGVAPATANQTGVCVFDFDDTLKICNENKPKCKAPDGERVLELCKEQGYAVTIATASCEHGFVKHFLQDQYGFSADFINTKCFQHCVKGPKDKQLRAILTNSECQNQSGEQWNYKCMVQFDDNEGNKQAADLLGVNWVKLDPEIGVTVDDFWKGNDLIKKNCNQSWQSIDKTDRVKQSDRQESANNYFGGGQVRRLLQNA